MANLKNIAVLMVLLCPLGMPAIAGTITYVYTDPQGTVLAEADVAGTITATFDYKPYGALAMGIAANGPGYTGHVNDPDTALIYMQARYMDPVLGRFVSEDPIGPKPGNLAYFNRYSYVEDNPISKTDPAGSYTCDKNSNNGDNCKEVTKAIKSIKRAAQRLQYGSEGRNLLDRVLQRYGDEGVVNGVNVEFGDAHGNVAETGTSPREKTVDITINMALVKVSGSFKGTNKDAELAATLAHEMQHGIDDMALGTSGNHEMWLHRELSAYRTESYVDQGLNVTSPYGLWTRNWRESTETEGLRNQAIEFNAYDTVFGKCFAGGKC